MSGRLQCEALIFDVDGTLADNEELHRQAFNRAFAACEVPWNWDRDLYRELLHVFGGKERLASYIGRLDLTFQQGRALQERIPELHRAKTRAYHELIAEGGLTLRAGVRRLVLEARTAGVRVAIASTTSPENIEPLIAAGLGEQALGWFDTVAAGDVVANKKPAPDIYLVALENLGVSADHAIAVEDSAMGVSAAKAAGLYTVATPNGWTRGQDFTGADLLLNSLGDPDAPLAPADAARIGGQFLSLDRLAALHAAARSGAADVKPV